MEEHNINAYNTAFMGTTTQYSLYQWNYCNMKLQNVSAKSATADSCFSVAGPRTLLTTITFMQIFCTLLPDGSCLRLCSYVDIYKTENIPGMTYNSYPPREIASDHTCCRHPSCRPHLCTFPSHRNRTFAGSNSVQRFSGWFLSPLRAVWATVSLNVYWWWTCTA